MNSRRIRDVAIGSIAALGLAWSMASSGATISNTVVAGFNSWSDNDGEVLINNDGSLSSGFPTITTGDYLVSALGFNQYNVTSGASLTNEATGLIILQVTGVAPTSPANCGGASSCSTYTFAAPTVGFNAVSSALGLGTFVDANGNPLTASTMGVIFFDNSRNFFLNGDPDNPASTIGSIFGDAIDGTVVGTVGLVSFTGSAPQDLVQLTSGDATIVPGQGAGGFQFQLSLISQAFPGFFITGNLNGTANISEPGVGPLVDNGIRTDTTVGFNARLVPEPTTLALLGISLIGIGLARRREV